MSNYTKSISSFSKGIFLAIVLFLLSCNLCNAQRYFITDAINAHKKKFKTLDSLILFLDKEGANDTEKAYGAYYWIARNVKYDIKKFMQGEPSNMLPEDVFKKRLAVCHGYSLLYEYMCNKLHVECHLVVGSPNTSYKKLTHKITRPTHGWNVIKLDSTWYLVDVTWASGGVLDEKFKAHFNQDFFKVAPRDFVKNHLPEMPMWQLLETTVPVKTFEGGSKAIAAYYNQNPPSYFYYKDTIQAYLAKDSVHQLISAGEMALAFNPSNTLTLAYAIINTTGDLIKSLPKAFDESTYSISDSLIQRIQYAKVLLKKSKATDQATKENMSTGKLNCFMYAGTLYLLQSEYLQKGILNDSINYDFNVLKLSYAKAISSLQLSMQEFKQTPKKEIIPLQELLLFGIYVKQHRTYSRLIEQESDENKVKRIETERNMCYNKALKAFPSSSGYHDMIKYLIK